MKPCFFFILMLLSAGLAASAQQQDPVMTRSQFTPFAQVPQVKLPGKPDSHKVTGKQSAIIEYYHEGALVDSNRLGKVYRMPVDNMLCLVPDASRTAGMPVKKTRMPEPMPNAFLQRRRF